MKLTVEHLTKRIVGRPVLQDVGFEWRPGEIIGLVGENGAGKTTLMRTLVNQYLPDGGTVAVDGRNLAQAPGQRVNLIYIDPSQVFFAGNTLAASVADYALAYPDFDRQRFFAAAADYDLAPGQRFRELSKGYQAVVVVLLSLCSNAPFVMLDEPFDGLDLFIREAIVSLVVDAVADGKRGLLIASHNLQELDGIADRILFLKRHTISHDYRLEDVREKAVKLQLVFKTPELPALIRENGRILNVQGRVVTVLFADYTDALDRQLRDLAPVYMEQRPLDLTDLFRSEFDHTEGGLEHA
ncbi:ABC transporter ATP-binding protein [Lacticaseibacillus parakribbianus]|uniref:ATP-binding cassette domain-containing protein n=1 Tax=Lacticaseibacillus parakribbianus TaxID=2970927 RepID=UPI0021CAE594|nr:ABC transporter ATP-binding protein [Lacticaseibacillus parakribbianus]